MYQEPRSTASDCHTQQKPQISHHADIQQEPISHIRLSHATRASNISSDTCNKNLKSHITLSHAKRTSNLTSYCHMEQAPQISHQPVTCYRHLQSHISLSHVTGTSNLTSDCHMEQEPKISHHTVTWNKNLKSHIKLSHAIRILT